jgi:hypothetical protein
MRVSFHDRVRVEEVLCAVARLTATSTDLPRAADIADEVGFDATAMLVYLAKRGRLNAYGPVRDSYYSLSPDGEREVARACRRAA